MAVDYLKHFVLRNKEILMFLAGFGVMHYGWYNLQRNETLSKALAASREKELNKEYKRLEREINEIMVDQPMQIQNKQKPQNASVILSAATAFTDKSSNSY